MCLSRALDPDIHLLTGNLDVLLHTLICSWAILKKNFFFQRLFIFGTERETEHEQARGRHRIGNRLQALSHQPRAQRGARTHGPRDRDLAEVGRLTDCATQAPLSWAIFIYLFFTEV